jgi:predicted RND superfamily exporter protein
LADYNNRDVSVIQGHLDTIKSALEQEIDGNVDILYGGSVAKHTYVDGISDIDALVLINKSELKDKSPAEVKKYFFERLQARLPRTQIGQGNLAVTVEFRDSEIQLLPAIRHESGFKIADFTGNNWSAIKPIEFTSLLTGINQNNGGKVVPTIKLAKSIISELPESQRLSGYHVEAIAVEVFQKYQGSKKTKDMLKYFFDEASRQVLRPIRDTTGQSMHVDDYLGSVNSADRNRVSKSLDRISRRMKNADGAQSIDQWRDILD